MSSKIFDNELLYQANAAKELAEALPAVGLNAHNSQVQVSIENAIVALLAPFQPAQAQKAQPTSERRQDGEAGNPGTASIPEPEDERCPDCGQIHTAEQKAHVERLRDLLEGIFGEGNVRLIHPTPGTKHQALSMLH